MAASVVAAATAAVTLLPIPSSFINNSPRNTIFVGHFHSNHRLRKHTSFELACVRSSSSSASRLQSSNSSSHAKPTSSPSTKLYVSGLSFRTTEESLRNAFKIFGQLVEVNLVMDKIANRPRGFAFLRYTNEEDSKKAIEGMHGKFLDGRVIFVEVAKPRSELRQRLEQNPR